MSAVIANKKPKKKPEKTLGKIGKKSSKVDEKTTDLKILQEENSRLVDQNNRMIQILHLSEELTNTNHIDIILDSVLEKTQKICNAEASSL